MLNVLPASGSGTAFVPVVLPDATVSIPAGTVIGFGAVKITGVSSTAGVMTFQLQVQGSVVASQNASAAFIPPAGVEPPELSDLQWQTLLQTNAVLPNSLLAPALVSTYVPPPQ